VDNQELRQELATQILLMECPTLSGRFNDPWQMFLYVRNKAVDIVTNNEGIHFDE